MEPRATISLILDPQSREPEKLLKIRITFNRQPRRYSSGCKIKLTEEQFNNDKLKITKQAKEQCQRAVNIATEIVNELGADFSFPAFTKEYKLRSSGKKKDMTLFCSIAEDYLNTQGLKNKTIAVYNTAINWVRKYDEHLKINNITSDLVAEWIDFVKKEHKQNHGKELSENTIRNYLRSLRTIFNYAIEQGKATSKNPFSCIKGQPLSSIPRVKIALDEYELARFIDYTPQNNAECFAKDFFLLTIQLSGMNLGDILSLKNKNIKGEYLEFRRKKTLKSGLITTIPLTNEARLILENYGHIDSSMPDDYILPYLAPCNTERSIDNKIHDIDKKLNNGLNSICQKLGLKKITTYAARHTYASFAQSAGMTAEHIQKFLGHTSSRTTQVYLSSLTKSVHQKNRELLDSIQQLNPTQSKNDSTI